MKLCWLDIRDAGAIKEAVCAEAVHQRLDAIVSDDVDDLDGLPPTVSRVLLVPLPAVPPTLAGIDLVIVESADPAALRARRPSSRVEFGRLVDVTDAVSLDEACRTAGAEAWTVLRFRESTRIPLEIVLAAAADAKGHTISVVADPDEAAVVFGVLEHGPDGVMLAPHAVGDATRLRQATAPQSGDVVLTELAVTAVTHVGMGERACVDTCTYLRPDEGILVGSHSKGMVLCVSETHPLPYMPTRPFRVNAGAIMSYTLSTGERTRYLSELRAAAGSWRHGRTGRSQ
jgi:3-amino-4-hydroxybenzoic acid synthase